MTESILIQQPAVSAEPDRREVYRYLGYRGQLPDERVREACERCIAELRRDAVPRVICREFPLSLPENSSAPDSAGEDPDGSEGAHRSSLSGQVPEIRIADLRIRSRNLAKNLRDCSHVLLFAATLGVEPDRQITRASVARVSDMVILQAAAAAMIEACCDSACGHLREKYRRMGCYLRPRFSPGYGDFSLTHQRDLIRMLDASKQIGITLTDSLLMVPSKSVTAVIGISAADTACPVQGCEACSKTDCTYRHSS